jgi:hypothetical protein
MCQCICCDCCWINCFGVICGGLHMAYCLCSCWLCKPDGLKAIDPECCHVCAWDGWGGNECCTGAICCSPAWVKQWSAQLKGGAPPQ